MNSVHSKTFPSLLLFVTLLLMFSDPTAASDTAPTLHLTPKIPRLGEPTRIEISLPSGDLSNVLLSVEEHPGSQVSQRIPLELSQPQGIAEWTPSQPGLVRIEARTPDKDQPLLSRDLAIAYEKRPILSTLILTAAGLFLFLGIAGSLRVHLSD